MDRRSFVKAAASAGGLAFGAGMLGAGKASAQEATDAAAGQGGRPNILVIKVDELRFPSVFPAGISSVAEFLKSFMPNVFQLWQSGVKFGNHFTAGTACTPARGCLITGLYTQQSWLLDTITDVPYAKAALQPVLNPVYPTYGKILRRAGYQTPYAGKWHVSIPPAGAERLEAYGFQGLTYYDPTGANLQGTYGDHANGYLNDQDIATQGIAWLNAHYADAAPWCLTVSFVNPHDREFFWAGTEFKTYDDLFASQTQYTAQRLYSTPDGANPPTVPWAENALKDPPSYGYPAVPPNWESADQLAANKPTTQTYSRLFSQLVWGGASDDATQTGFTIAPYPIPASGSPPQQLGIGIAPYRYWHRGLDSYTQLMSIVDQRIGEVLQAFAALPASVVRNTVIVFTSDHGEYAGAHGYLSGKIGSLYDEAFHVPLIVVDPSGRFTGDIDTLRDGLTSSVDMLPLLASLGYGGSRSWLTGNLKQIYGRRHDLLPMLRSAQAPGRHHVLLATDEAVPNTYDFNQSPTHLVGLRTAEFKFGLYANWAGPDLRIADDGQAQTELYDYTTAGGQAELDNLRDSADIARLLRVLVDDLIPNELRAPLPGVYGVGQKLSRDAYRLYTDLVIDQSASFSLSDLPGLFGYGRDF